MLDKCSALMTRIHKLRWLKKVNLAAARIQASFKAFKARRAFLCIRNSVLTIQRSYRMLKIARSWDFREAVKAFKHKSTTTIQKFLRGYLTHKKAQSLVQYTQLEKSLKEVEEFIKVKQLKIKEDLQIGIAYLFRRMVRNRKKAEKPPPPVPRIPYQVSRKSESAK